MNKRFAVLGSPIAHSKSPAIHQAAYRVLGYDWEYGRAEVQRGGLRRFIAELDQPCAGFSVTMPLKEEATKFAEVHDEYSQLTKATNTLAIDDNGVWHGFNTDVFGIVESLRKTLPEIPKRVLIIGSGATAISAVTAVRSFAPKAVIWVFARNHAQRESVVKFAKSIGLHARSVANLKRHSKTADLTISSVPAGAMDDVAGTLMQARFWAPRGALLDVAYNPWPSKLALAWTNRERQVISGLEMLIWQAVAQIRIFTYGSIDRELNNEIAVVEAMREAASPEL